MRDDWECGAVGEHEYEAVPEWPGYAGKSADAAPGSSGLEGTASGTSTSLLASVLCFLQDPVNIALVVWVVLALPACVLSILLKLALLNRVVPDPGTREDLDESCTQLVNALFVLACLVGLPLLFRHVLLLLRWQPNDRRELRGSYCRGGTRKPHDRAHMAAVVFWAQLTCWATFAYSAMYWLYPIHSRPYYTLIAVNVVAKGSTMVSFLYLLLSPLSQEFSVVRDDAPLDGGAALKMFVQTPTFVRRQRQVARPEWSGSAVPGCCQDPRVAALVCLLPCCMFGAHAARLGFGHRAVHSLACAVVLLGPLLVFAMAAHALRGIWAMDRVAALAGAALALCGLAYGGAWRVKMRETFRLPPGPRLGPLPPFSPSKPRNTASDPLAGPLAGKQEPLGTFPEAASSSAASDTSQGPIEESESAGGFPGAGACPQRERAADVCLWVWCPCCALCQEIRTARQYSVEHHTFCDTRPVRVCASCAAMAEGQQDGPAPWGSCQDPQGVLEGGLAGGADGSAATRGPAACRRGSSDSLALPLLEGQRSGTAMEVTADLVAAGAVCEPPDCLVCRR